MANRLSKPEIMTSTKFLEEELKSELYSLENRIDNIRELLDTFPFASHSSDKNNIFNSQPVHLWPKHNQQSLATTLRIFDQLAGNLIFKCTAMRSQIRFILTNHLDSSYVKEIQSDLSLNFHELPIQKTEIQDASAPLTRLVSRNFTEINLKTKQKIDMIEQQQLNEFELEIQYNHLFHQIYPFYIQSVFALFRLPHNNIPFPLVRMAKEATEHLTYLNLKITKWQPPSISQITI